MLGSLMSPGGCLVTTSNGGGGFAKLPLWAGRWPEGRGEEYTALPAMHVTATICLRARPEFAVFAMGPT